MMTFVFLVQMVVLMFVFLTIDLLLAGTNDVAIGLMHFPQQKSMTIGTVSTRGLLTLAHR